MQTSNEHYGALSIAMHWLMLLLMIATYAFIGLRDFFPRGSDPRENLRVWHSMFGLLIFALVWIRLLIRLSGPTPQIKPQLTHWQEKAANFTHLGLYIFMLVTPLLGWIVLSAGGKQIPFFGLELPPLVGESKDLKNLIKEVHEIFGSTGYFLIAIHASAALYHHYMLKDNTLIRMLPWIKNRL